MTVQNQLSELTFWRRLMITIIVGGLLLTAMVAGLQQRAAERERALMLSAEADRVTGLLVDSIESRIGSFTSSVNFVAATHPGPLDQYQQFMLTESDLPVSDDPGVMVFESVSSDDVEALAEREAALGNTDFKLTLFGDQPGERFILTRLVRDPGFSGLRLLGIDATSVRDQVIPDALIQDESNTGEFQLYVAESAEALRLLPTQPDVPNGMSDHVVFLVARLPGAPGPGRYVVASLSAADMIGAQNLAATTDLHLALSVGDVAGTVFHSHPQAIR